MNSRFEHSRRSFLLSSGRALGALGIAGGLARFGVWSAYAVPDDEYRALVCVFLFGGNDGNNTVIPLDMAGYNAYRNLRGPLAMPTTRLAVIGSRLGSFGLHEGLASVAGLYREGRAAVVANMGMLVRPLTRDEYRARTTPVPARLFSHEDQVEQMQAGFPRSATSGWGGRAADRLAPLNQASPFPASVSVSGGPLFCVGEQTQPARLSPGVDLGLLGFTTSPAQDAAARQQAHRHLLQLDGGVTLVAAANRQTTETIELDGMLKALDTTAPFRTLFPTTNLGRQLQQVAKFIRARDALEVKRQVFFCGMGGFDTHAKQDVDQSRLLGELGPALTAFYRATEEMGVASQVTTFTESDFGRTLQPSGDGSDHAWGSHYLVLGGGVRGGEVYGRFPALQLAGPDDAGSRGSWIPTTSLDEYGATLARWFGVGEADLDLVFPNLANFSSRDVGFMV